MSSVVSNANGFIGALEGFEKRFHRMFADKIRGIMTEGMDRLLKKTPVWTGEAVMNYVASKGVHRGPLKKADGPVEATNKLSLGAEQLRAGAEAIARATLANVDYSNPYKTFYITNRTPHIGGLEYGQLPKAPYVPRSPNGMFGVTVQELISMLESGRL